MKKIFDALFYISIAGIIISGIFGFIYDYLIWDKSNFPDFIFNVFAIIGYICLIYAAAYYFLKRKK